jgi:hypothetical protein
MCMTLGHAGEDVFLNLRQQPPQALDVLACIPSAVTDACDRVWITGAFGAPTREISELI